MFFIPDPFDCGATIGCGGDGWLISNKSLLAFVTGATCNDKAKTPFSSLAPIECQCPLATILPCTCQATDGHNTTLTIDCSSQGLDDADMETIVKNIPATTPVAILNLQNNSLTHIPANLPQYTQLVSLNMSSNAITVVNAGDLTVAAFVTSLDLSSNAIAAISANSLPRNYSLRHFFIRLLKSDDLNSVIFI